MDKIRVYVTSVEPSTCEYVDMHSLEHPCSQAGDRAFEGLQYLPGKSSGFLSDDEMKTVDLVAQVSRENGLEFETIDLANSSLTVKMKFYLKGWKTPLISYKGVTLSGLSTKEELQAFLHK